MPIQRDAHATTHTAAHTTNHAADNTTDHAEDNVANHTADQAADHTTDHGTDHAADPTVDHAADHVVNHGTDHVAVADLRKSYSFWHEALGHPASLQLSSYEDVPSYGNSQYYISFIDNFARMMWVYFLKNKSDAVGAIRDFVTMIERQFNTTILCFRTDNGTEYVNAEVKQFFNSKGIRHELTPPYSHESNGIAERFNRTIRTMMRAMLINLDKNLWAEAVQCLYISRTVYLTQP